MERITTSQGAIYIDDPDHKRMISGEWGIEAVIIKERTETITYRETYTVRAMNLTQAIRILEEENPEADKEQEIDSDTDYGDYELVKLTLVDEEVKEEPMEGQLDMFGGIVKREVA